MKKTILFFMNLVLILNLGAQDITDESGEEGQKLPRFILKWSASDIVDIPAPMLRFALEYRINQRHALQYSLGWGSSAWLVEGSNDQSFKTRLEYKFYFRDKAYVQGQLTYKRSLANRELTICRANCAFFEEVDGDYESDMFAYSLGLGRQSYLSEHWIFDYGLALGVSKHTTTYEGIEEDRQILNEGGSIFPRHPSFSVGQHLWPYILLQFKIGYVF